MAFLGRAMRGIALVLVAGATLSCERIFMGGYQGLCDEPRSLYTDLGPPEKVRMAQCQVDGNICCRRRDRATLGFATDKRTYCLTPYECYIGRADEPCFGDVDCEPNLTCVGGSLAANAVGKCACPANGRACGPAGGTFCCPSESICGAQSCVEPEAASDGGG